MKKNFLIIADAPGDFELMHSDEHVIIALDGVANRLAAILEKPDFILGDMDSITQDTVDYMHEQGVEFIQEPDQNLTDLDKGIEFCDSQGAESILILNSTGGRTDHTMLNIRLLKKHYNSNRRIQLISNNEVLEYIKDSTKQLEGNKGDAVAIMAFPSATVTSQGLEYEMQKHRLDFAYSESPSNALASETAKIAVEGEALLIYNKNSVLT